MGESTSLARLQALAAREALDEELVRLEASARAAVDVPAKIKRHPVKSAGLGAGAGFVVVGGPRRVLRGTRHAIFGRPAPLPESMLPKEIDASLRRLGDDGEQRPRPPRARVRRATSRRPSRPASAGTSVAP